MNIEFREAKPKYERLAEETSVALKRFLLEREISSFDIEHRVKDEKSFEDKIVRKGYQNPFEEIEDIAGVRVICYYKNDLKSIHDIIQQNFDVLSVSNKAEELDVDQFGYTSNHYVVTIKQEWLVTPHYNGLDGLKVEIQVRTMLMHAWAAISHKLLYKKQDDVPNEFKRKLNRLSALIELADEQFDDIQLMKNDYQQNVQTSQVVAINADSFIAIAKQYFPERDYKEDDVPSFLSELREYVSDLNDFESRIQRCMPILEEMEREEQPSKEYPVWGLVGISRTVLDLTSEEYFAKRNLPPEIAYITDKYRKKI